MIEKLDMKSMDITEENVKKIQALFPNAVTEVIVDGKTTLKIDFDVLKQELSANLIEDKQERYQMTWPDKSKAKVLANSRITSTLRPDKEKSVDFDNTQNLYIEGDNLDVLKLLRETYLGKVKMIYIDPPYNTGNDFVYNDDFSVNVDEYMETSGQYDEEGNRLVKNLESNGRFHTDWLNMIYPRLKVAKDLLSDDGIIFISIDDCEQSNLKKICDEIFGEDNFVSNFIWKSRQNKDNRNITGVSIDHEYILCYSKTSGNRALKGAERKTEQYQNPDNDPRGPWTSANMAGLLPADQRPNCHYDLINPETGINYGRPAMGWRYDKNTMNRLIKEKRILWPETVDGRPRKKSFLSEISEVLPGFSSIVGVDLYTRNATIEVEKLFDKRYFDFPKPIDLIKEFIVQASNSDSIIVDFFSGSATTAHAVMQLNAEDGGNRKFIMVQLPEECDEKSEAYKAGYKTICEIGEERIRRAGAKIKSENGLTADKLDTGFRVLKLDSSNMQDVYYNPMAMRQSLLDETIDNVKSDRTPLDLLFQVMLDLGVELSAKIEEKQVNGKTYYVVNGNDLIACFDEDIDNSVITEIAKQQPLYAVFKSTSFATDSASINNEQLFKTYSPATVIKVI